MSKALGKTSKGADGSRPLSSATRAASTKRRAEKLPRPPQSLESEACGAEKKIAMPDKELSGAEILHALKAAEFENQAFFSEAAEEIWRSGRSPVHSYSVEIAVSSRFEEKNEDTLLIQKWLKKRRLPPEEIEVIRWLSILVLSEWELPKLTESEHRKLYEEIAKLCDQLVDALRSTGAVYSGKTGRGLIALNVFRLLDGTELEELKSLSQDAEGNETHTLAQAAYPSVEQVLKRTKDLASQLKNEQPRHQQPKRKGAQHGYFARRMGDLFEQRYKKGPPSVLAALAAVAMGASGGASDVAKTIKRHRT